MKLRVISPHRDDAAFSLALSIHDWLRRGHQVQVLNIFTQSEYSPLHRDDAAGAERVRHVSARRKREDETFRGYMPGLEVGDLGLQDAPLRLGCRAEDVCSQPADRDDDAALRIKAALTAGLGNELSFALVLPLALGGHVDHRVVRDAAVPFSARLPCAFYEDLPYAMRDGVRSDLLELKLALREGFQQALTPVISGLHPHAQEFKLRRSGIYSSQIDATTAHDIAEFCIRYGGGERLWANEPWLALALANGLSTPQYEPEALPLSL